MTAEIDPVIAEHLRGRVVQCAYLVECRFASQTAYFWNGNRTITAAGKKWIGLKRLGSIEGMGEKDGIQAEALKVTLAAPDDLLPPNLLAIANDTDRAEYAGRILQVSELYFDSDWQVLVEPEACATNYMDAISVSQIPRPIEQGGGSIRTISIEAYNIWYGRRLSPFSFYSDRNQQQRFAGDRFCEFMQELTNYSFKVPW